MTPDLSTLGDRLPVGDPRGIIAHLNYGEREREWVGTRFNDAAHGIVRRDATPLEVGLLKAYGILPADHDGPVTCRNRFIGAIRAQTFHVGGVELVDDRTPPAHTNE